MSVNNLNELEQKPVGALIQADEINQAIPFKPISRSKWEGPTNNHNFVLGDVFVVENNSTIIGSFRNYINKRFELGVEVLKKGDKAYCKCRPKAVPVKKRGRPKKKRIIRTSVPEVNFE